MKVKLITLIIFISIIGCESELMEHTVIEEFNTVNDTIIFNDTIHSFVSDTLFVNDTINNVFYDTIYHKVYDTIKIEEIIHVNDTIRTYKTIYDTITQYNPTMIAIRFLYENENQQVSGVDSIYLDSPDKVTWTANGNINIIEFKLVE